MRNLERVDRLRSSASDKRYTVAQLALARVIANLVVSVALTGKRRASEIEQNVEAVDWDMPEDERELIRSIVTEN